MASLLPSSHLHLIGGPSPVSAPAVSDPKHSITRSWWPPLLPSDRKKRTGDGDCTPSEEHERREPSAVLTADKARVLRKKMRATESWHDAMYHSAVASRLACPDD